MVFLPTEMGDVYKETDFSAKRYLNYATRLYPGLISDLFSLSFLLHFNVLK